MPTWFQTKIRYQQQDDKGKVKTISETYLIDAVSYTDAEARTYDIVARNTPEFNLHGLSRMKLAEVFFEENNAEKWFKAKVSYISFDEKAQKEKKIPYNMLINAHNPREVYDLLIERLGKVQDYEITDINLTNILDVFPYEKEDEILSKGNFRPLAQVLAEQES